MKSLITLVENNCKSCLKCVRSCPTKSIKFERNHPYIIEEECIHCGNCYLHCPQSAKRIHSDLELVKSWLTAKQEVVVSVAPSYQVVWKSYTQLKNSLLKLGFSAVEETAKGAYVVSSEYGTLLKEKRMNNIIETCCPTIVELIEKEYPELIPYLSPIASPMIIHGRMLKEKYPNAKVVFLSPCISKQHEILDPRFAGAVDAVISMPEMDEWILKRDIQIEEEPVEENIARIYPVSGGIIKTLEDLNGYKTLAVEGIARCRALLDSIKDGHLNGYFFELNACVGGCLGGPYLTAYSDYEWIAQSKISEFEKSSKIKPDSFEFTKASYESKKVDKKRFTEYEIHEVLSSMGKQDYTKRLNCGACGYNTCRAKAIAVLEGKADPKHCLPYALENSQSVSSLIIEHSPNGIIVLDKYNKIKEINNSAKHLLGTQNYSVRGFNVEAVLHYPPLIGAINRRLDEVTYYVVDTHGGEKVCEIALVPLKEENAHVLILMDLTAKREQEEKMKKLRQETIDSTQKVIDKQMRVVQEIASLLGETTAETKVVLTKLNKAFSGDDIR